VAEIEPNFGFSKQIGAIPKSNQNPTKNYETLNFTEIELDV